MVRLALGNDYARARALHRRLYPLSKALFVESNPAPIKAALARAGLIGSAEVRPPLSELSPAGAALLERVLKALEKN
jgi:4-hydroxy-tetrahydrodipicolinate synthase